MLEEGRERLAASIVAGHRKDQPNTFQNERKELNERRELDDGRRTGKTKTGKGEARRHDIYLFFFIKGVRCVRIPGIWATVTGLASKGRGKIHGPLLRSYHLVPD